MSADIERATLDALNEAHSWPGGVTMSALAAHVAARVAEAVAAHGEDAPARLAAVEGVAAENESWEWQAPVGPGNASYANGYENGRRAVGADLRAALGADSAGVVHRPCSTPGCCAPPAQTEGGERG